MGDGLIGRMLRALRLDPTLYREVAAPGASTEQAALVVILAAAGFSFSHSARSLVSWLGAEGGGVLSAVTSTEANRWIAMDFENYRVALGVLALAAAWPVWTAGVWLVAKRLVAPGGQRPGYGQVARVLAFAQAPGVFGPALLLPATIGAAHVFSQRGWIAHGEPAPPGARRYLGGGGVVAARGLGVLGDSAGSSGRAEAERRPGAERVDHGGRWRGRTAGDWL